MKVPGGGGGDSSSACEYDEAVNGIASEPPSVPGTGGFTNVSKTSKHTE